MRKLLDSNSVTIFFCFVVLVAGLGTPVMAGEKFDQIRHVLLLNSYHQQMTWVQDVVQGVDDVMSPDQNNLTIHVENMDSKVFFSSEYFDIFRDYLSVKYRDITFSLILSSDNNAFDFLRNHRDILFPGVPVSFCGVNNFNEEQIAGLMGFTGVAEIFSARETMDIALKLHPATTDVFIINDYLKTGRAWARDIDKDLQGLPRRLLIRHAENLAIEDLMNEILKLGPNTVVLLGVYFSDRDGRYFTYERIGAMLSEASNVPVYCLLEFNIGRGVIGGQVISGYYQGKTMARIGREILKGTDPASIPVKMQGSNRVVFDYTQLVRFGVEESLLPPESYVINRPYSFYEEYKTQVWMVAGFITVLLGTILALGVNFMRRLRAERALRASEERFRQLANATWEAIVVHERGIFFHGNDFFYSMFGFTSSELQGKQTLPLILASESVSGVSERIERGDLGPYEAVGCHKNGNTFPIEVRVREMEYEGRNVRMAAIRDLTERKRMEERLAQSQKLEAIGTLAGGIAHDFNNILSAIIGYSEITLLNVEKDSKVSQNIGEVLRAGNRAKNLVQQILTFARKAKDEKRPIQVSLIVNEALKLLRASLPASIEIQKTLSTNAQVLSDTTQIHQILMNLCTNAGKAMVDGGVLTVTLKEVDLDKEFIALHSGMSAGRYLQLTVGDTGVGIPAEVKSRIFDPFFTTRNLGEGTGLGLSVVHGIVNDCQGVVTVSSNPGGDGSTFDVYLPVIAAERPEPELTIEDLPGGSERILFVDDEKVLVKMAKDILINLGYAVTVHTSSSEALDEFRQRPYGFDLVITDMTMPEMTGDKLAYEILAIRPNIPVILCTGYSEQITEEEALAGGIRSFLMKPVVVSKLARTIREAVAGPSQQL